MLIGHLGRPPAPHDLWTSWNFDPAVIVPLAVGAWLYVRGLGRAPRTLVPGRGAVSASVLGFVAVAVALLSPLDALGEALASAHMVQHLVLTFVAAPLLAFGRPWEVVPWAVGRPARKWLARRVWSRVRISSIAANHWVAGASFIVVVSIWHGRRLYEAALATPLVHGLEHVTFFAAGLLLWGVVARGFGSGRSPAGATILMLFVVAMHGVFLSALMTFAGQGWYPSYRSTAPWWGFSWVEDQNLAGVIMWTWGSLVYVGAGVAAVARVVASAEDPVRPGSASAGST